MKTTRSRGNRVVVLLSDEENTAFARAADNLGLTTATWLRLLGRRAAGLPTLGE